MLNLINNHAHGYVVTPVVLACNDAGLFELLRQGPKDFDRLAEALRANRGHLRVAMRMFESLGWVRRDADDVYAVTEAAAAHRSFPREAQSLFALPMDRYLRGEDGLSLAPWFERSRASWDTDDTLVRELLDGAIITPLMLALEQRGGLKEARRLSDLWSRPEGRDLSVPEHVQHELAGFFFAQKWTREATVDAELTPKGAFIFERALLFAIVGSYRPMLASMPQLLFGDCEQVFGRDEAGHELHLDRTLNVIGSGHQHRKYFAELEKLIITIFDAENLSAQPRYIADMGCGDGTLLKRVYETVIRHTRRGRALDRFPLTLIAADFNEKALEAAGRTLAGLEHVALRADVARPDRLIEDLRARGLAEPENTLHIRSFLDHDRPYQPPADRAGLHARIPFDSVFVGKEGQEVVPAEVFHSLVEHLERWAAILHRHPLVILEVHCLPAPVVRGNLSQSESLHFDAYHRFSHQMLVEANHFLLAAAQAGLFARDDVIRRFPRTLSFTRMTLTQFEKRSYRIRWARLGDLPALERLERECWDAELRASDAVLKARVEKYPQGQLVLELEGQVVGAIYSQRIRDDGVLQGSTAETVDTLHTDTGPVVQLLGVNVSPSAQHSRLGDRLLEFMLQYCALSNDVAAVVGVTRCKAYGRHAHLSLEQYVAVRDEHGLSVDPVLRFHQIHGAELGELVVGYRVRDADNHGHGVMVRYDVHNRVRRDAPVEDAEIASPAPAVTARGVASTETEHYLRQVVARIVECDTAAVRLDLPLMELGVDSVGLMELAEHIGRRFELKLEETFFFEHNTLDRIGAFLAGRSQPVVAQPVSAPVRPEPVPAPSGEVSDQEIAVVGVACRLPGGVQTPRQLWDTLIARQSLVGTLEDIRWRWSGLGHAAASGHVAHASDVDRFDAAFFNISPAEAELMDPQQRLLLELSWQCIEDAGHDPLRLAGSDTGVFVGASGSDYKTLQDKYGRDIAPQYAVATSTSVIPNRISYFFDFSGPSVQVDTACSSSLVALDQALRALRSGECGQALVGAVSLICEPSNTVCYQRAGMLSEDGRCKTFDASANGYVRGEGAVVFLLKPLKKALADKDPVYGVVMGSAVNHGGRTAGLTAPNPQKQAELVCKALQAANVAPEEVGYIEAHGTGTSLGDPVETKGLVTAFDRMSRAKGARSTGRCAVGSVKTNIGHLEAAAGAAGLLKALLCLGHKRIPANLHFEQMNPRIGFTGTPFYVSHEEHPWELSEGQARRVAGVSSFGSGGTNAHVLVREHVATRPVSNGVGAGGRYLVLLSARTERALERREADLLTWLQANPLEDLGDVSASLAMGRAHWGHRSAYVVSSHGDLCEQLSLAERRRVSTVGATKFDSLRKQRFLQRLQQVFPHEVLLRAAREGAGFHDDLCALADLYLLGSEFDWQPMFSALLTRRLRLPAYPFERDSYWLHPEEAADGIPAVVKAPVREPQAGAGSWLCVAQKWVPTALEDGIDWRVRLERYAGKELAIVYQEADDLASFKVLLSAACAGLGDRAPRVHSVDARDFGDGLDGNPFPVLPDVVFSLGASEPEGQGALRAAQTVFRISQTLMRAAGDRAVRLYHLHEVSPSQSAIDAEALGGFIRSAMLENAAHVWKVVGFSADGAALSPHQALLQEWLSDPEAPPEIVGSHVCATPCEVRHAQAQRALATFVEVSPEQARTDFPKLRQGGTYLVTGGLGPVGEQVCRQMARRYQPTLVFFSRSSLDPVREAQLETLRSLGAKVEYHPVDITDPAALRSAWAEAKARVGVFHGILHLARLVEDGPIYSKRWASFERVVAAKARGTVLLDEVSANEPLELFLLFSSVAAFGIRGSSDYGYATAYQNAFARHRNEQVKRGERSGRTVSQCWGPWTVDSYMPERRDERFAAMGWGLIEPSQALEAIDQSLQLSEPVVALVRTPSLELARRVFGLARSNDTQPSASSQWAGLEEGLRRFEAGGAPAPAAVAAFLADYDLEQVPTALVERAHRLMFSAPVERAPRRLATGGEALERAVRDALTEVLKLRGDYSDDQTFQSFGMDSISATQLATRLEKKLAMPILPRWFLEFSTARALIRHLAAQSPQRQS